MKPEWIKSYENNAMKGEVEIPGACCFSQELGVALGYTFNDVDSKLKEGYKPTLLVCSIRNIDSFSGFSMNSMYYSSYPAEKEVLMNEGMVVDILSVHEVLIENNDESFKPYNNHTVTIIHLNH